MAAFEWGSDFAGSIRWPAGSCGVVGLRLSTSAWPVEEEHFPKLPPSLWDMCGMGPITREVEGARAVMRAVRGFLRRPKFREPKLDPSRVVLWAPDAVHAAEWPTFVGDVGRIIDEAKITWSVARELPSPSRVNALYIEKVGAHFDDMMRTGELSFWEGAPAVALSLLTLGKLDRRVHPNTAVLLTGLAALRLIHRDRARTRQKIEAIRAQVQAIWDSGALIIAPTNTVRPPRHNRAAMSMRLASFCMLGNLVDATGLAIPCGHFPGTPALPRSIQIMGPPGSEEAVLDMGARLMDVQRRG
jgi:Asp-tRNA(Asn)/Glu-tRNA(Gln) amidotransferase A subunit family amidase